MTDLIRLLTRAQKTLRAATDDALRVHDVRIGQNLVLELLWAEDGLTPGEVAARMGVTTPTVVNTATRMEAAGLLERRRDEHDGRLVRLHLTARGRAVREPIERVRAELSAYALATLTDEERRHMESALGKIIDRMAGYGTPPEG